MVQVPVVAVVDQALRRNLAVAVLVAAAAVVLDHQAPPAQQRGAHGLEVRQVQAARAHRLHADAAAQV